MINRESTQFTWPSFKRMFLQGTSTLTPWIHILPCSGHQVNINIKSSDLNFKLVSWFSDQ